MIDKTRRAYITRQQILENKTKRINLICYNKGRGLYLGTVWTNAAAKKPISVHLRRKLCFSQM